MACQHGVVTTSLSKALADVVGLGPMHLVVTMRHHVHWPCGCADVWLLRSPSGSDVHDCVWAVVAMVALSAMAYRRAALWHMSLDEGLHALPDGDAQTLITGFYPVVRSTVTRAPPASCVDRACRRAAVKFWMLFKKMRPYLDTGFCVPGCLPMGA